jgi:hypothetical protein
MTTTPYKATITINIEGPNSDEAAQAFQNAIDGIGFGSGGHGFTPNGTSYNYTVESSEPKVPMTLERLLQLVEDTLDTEEQREDLRNQWGMHNRTDPNGG